MFSLKITSLSTKLILVTSLVIAVVLVLSNFFLISQTRSRVSTLTMAQAQAEARSIANEVAVDMGQLAGAARSMAGVIGRGHAAGYLDRKGVTDALKANLEQNVFAYGSWFAEVPGAFDGKNAELVGNKEMGANKKGELAPTGPRAAPAISPIASSTSIRRRNGTHSRQARKKVRSPSPISKARRATPSP